jgi:hypothetical protein
MFAVFEHFDAVTHMAGGVGGDKDSFDAIVLHQFFEGRVSLPATTGPGELGTAVRNEIADGHDLDIGMILETEVSSKFADTISDDADTNLPVRNGFPTLRSVWVNGAALESLDYFFLAGNSLRERHRG